MNLFFKIGCVATLLFSAIGLGATPRAEYPRPQFERADWQNLNGEWTYQLDLGKSGMNRHLYESKGFDDKITVPFAPRANCRGWNIRISYLPCGITVRYRFRNHGKENGPCSISEAWIFSHMTASCSIPD